MSVIYIFYSPEMVARKKTPISRDARFLHFVKGFEWNLAQIHCESKKLGHFYFYCNFVKCWPILIISFAS